MTRVVIRCLGLLLLMRMTLVSGSAAAADDWKKWRGPTRDGWVRSKDAPGPLAREAGRRSGRRRRARAIRPRLCPDRWCSCMSRKDPDEVVTAYDLRDGRGAWTDRYAASFTKNKYAVEMAKGPNSTPVAADGRCSRWVVTAVLTSYDASTGRVGEGFLKVDRYGETVLAAPRCRRCSIAACCSYTLVTIATARWCVRCGDGRGEVAAGCRWSGLCVADRGDIAGRRQLITLTDKSIIGVAVDRGELLWRVPFPDEWNENIVTPIVSGNRVIVAGVRQGTIALDVTRGGAGAAGAADVVGAASRCGQCGWCGRCGWGGRMEGHRGLA